VSRPDPPFDLEVTDRLLSTTRAVRRRLDFERPVPREVILDCIRLAQQAPTASNSQTWRWLVVTDPERRRALAEIYRAGSPLLEQYRENLDPGDRQTRRVYDSALYLMEHMHEAPALVIPCVEGRLPAGAPNGLAASVYGSIFGAVWSFQLALRSRGLGSVLTTIHLFREDEVAKLLGIPENVMQCALLPVAYTRGTEFAPARRPPPESITAWDDWGNRG
jgi:nitroreductase